MSTAIGDAKALFDHAEKSLANLDKVSMQLEVTLVEVRTLVITLNKVTTDVGILISRLLGPQWPPTK